MANRYGSVGLAGALLLWVALSGCGDEVTPDIGDRSGNIFNSDLTPFAPGTSQPGATCAIGGMQACSCANDSGNMICRSDGTWSACLCDDAATIAQQMAMSGGTGGTDMVTTEGMAGMPGMAAMPGMAGMAGISGEVDAGLTDAGGGGETEIIITGDGPSIPTTSVTCPTLATGNVTVLGQQVQLWVGQKQADKTGAVMFYWHGTGSNSGEASSGLGGAIAEITGEGGIVASFTTSTTNGMSTANNVWYTGDFEMADIILACAVEQLNIDERRIYTAGCSAGGLQAGTMVYERSGYLAGAMPNSGGRIFSYALQDPSHMPSVITVHGALGDDFVGVEFTETSKRLTDGVIAEGGIAVNCDHGGGHCRSSSALKASQWEFLKAHPFGVSPSPYASGLPSSFPAYCQFL